MRVHTQTQTAPRCQKTSQCVDSSMTTHRCCKHAGRERAVVRTFESVLGNGSGIDHPRSPSTRLVPSKADTPSIDRPDSFDRTSRARGKTRPPLSHGPLHHFTSPGPLHLLLTAVYLPPPSATYHPPFRYLSPPFRYLSPPFRYLSPPLPFPSPSLFFFFFLSLKREEKRRIERGRGKGEGG